MSKRRSKQKNPPLPKEISISSEEELKEMEADPRFQEMMKQADRDEREGGWTSMDEITRAMGEVHGRRR